MSSPAQRTLGRLKDESWTPWKVEQIIPRVNTRRDLFNIIDILAIRPGRTLGIQCYGSGEFPAHLSKMLGDHRRMTKLWIEAGNELQLWGWSKYKEAIGGKVWRPTIHVIHQGASLDLSVSLVVDGREE